MPPESRKKPPTQNKHPTPTHHTHSMQNVDPLQCTGVWSAGSNFTAKSPSHQLQKLHLHVPFQDFCLLSIRLPVDKCVKICNSKSKGPQRYEKMETFLDSVGFIHVEKLDTYIRKLSFIKCNSVTLQTRVSCNCSF